MQLNKSLLQKIIEIFVYLGCRTSNFTAVTVLKLLKVTNQMYIPQWLLRPVSNSSPCLGTQGAQRNANLTGFQTSKDQLLAIKMACPALFFARSGSLKWNIFFPFPFSIVRLLHKDEFWQNIVCWKIVKCYTMRAYIGTPTTDARWGNRLHCTAKNQLPIPNF